jgi:hypothetical protein
MFLELRLLTVNLSPLRSPPPPQSAHPRLYLFWICNFSQLNIDLRRTGFIKTVIGDFLNTKINMYLDHCLYWFQQMHYFITTLV